ncbi:putative Ecdysteroid kinase-containing protein 8, partial [Homarus americanus]
ATTETTKSAGPQNNITETYVEKVLKADKGNDAQLTSWSIKDFTQKGDNYATVVTSVSVNFSLHGQNQSVSYVVKINPQRDLGKDFSDMFGAIFRKEAEFYEKIIPLLNSELTTLGLRQLRMAKWYYSFLEEGREMIFLEDLRPRGYQMFDRRKGMDVPHATLVLQELARMHAASRFLQARTPDQDLLDKFKTIKTDWLNCTDSGGQMFHNMISTHFSIAEELLHKVEGIVFSHNVTISISSKANQVLMWNSVYVLAALVGVAVADTIPYTPPRPSYNAPAPAGPAQYEFDWTMNDANSGNNYGHNEARTGYDTQGSY